MALTLIRSYFFNTTKIAEITKIFKPHSTNSANVFLLITVIWFILFCSQETNAATATVSRPQNTPHDGSPCRGPGECDHARTALQCLGHCVCPGSVTYDVMHEKRLLTRWDRVRRKCIAGLNTVCNNRTAHHKTAIDCEGLLYCEPFKQDPLFGFCNDGTVSSGNSIFIWSNNKNTTTSTSMYNLLLIFVGGSMQLLIVKMAAAFSSLL